MFSVLFYLLYSRNSVLSATYIRLYYVVISPSPLVFAPKNVLDKQFLWLAFLGALVMKLWYSRFKCLDFVSYFNGYWLDTLQATFLSIVFCLSIFGVNENEMRIKMDGTHNGRMWRSFNFMQEFLDRALLHGHPLEKHCNP